MVSPIAKMEPQPGLPVLLSAGLVGVVDGATESP
jgi:hypothetical protein